MVLPESSTSPESLPLRLKAQVAAHNEGCYWPGPWTLGLERSEQLVARNDDIENLVYGIRDANLTVLSGDSGVGKSSLLLAGLIPALQNDGYKALVCRDWKDTRTAAERERGLDGLSHFLTSKLADDLAAYAVVVPDPDELVTQLDDEFGSEVVLILDQFEEVIRQQPQLFADLCEWIEATVDRSQLRVVISLRSEYSYRLDDLRVGAYRRKDTRIPAIRSRQKIREIILSRRADADDVAVMPDDAVEAILREWVTAEADKPRSRIRLLHLQALLYALWLERSADGSIGPDVVEAFLADARAHARDDLRRSRAAGSSADISDRDVAMGIFDWALAHVVHVHVELCSRSFDELREEDFVDAPLDEGVRHCLVRLAEHLSSGGYKVDQEEIHLAELVLSDELRTLGFFDEDDDDVHPEESARRIIATMAQIASDDAFDWVAVPVGELEEHVWAQLQERFGSVPHALPIRGVSAGAMLGAPSERVLIEEARRFFFALHWLHAGNIIRSSPSDDGRNFVALTHDGFGRGLGEWADDNDARPETALHSLTASFGKAFDWPTARARDADLNPLYRIADGGSKVYVNLRWRACRVVGSDNADAQIRNVVFLNCDLRGTSFQHCTFQGVMFINCLLDGVQFEDCKIVGRASPLESATPAATTRRELPSFVRQDQDDLVATLRHYQGETAADAQWLFSRTSGESVRGAVVEERGGTRVAHHRGKDYTVTGDAPPQDGGLTMFGGRLSSLAFYRCDFPQTAEVSLRHVAGTSLDFFEHEGGRVELYDVALRGVTVSPPITASLPGATPVPVELEAVDSHLENVWFSAGLTGTAEFKNSIVWQLFNGSLGTQKLFDVALDCDSPFLGIVNVPDDKVQGPPMAKVWPDDAGRGFEEKIREFVGRIDYRSPRENVEYERRLGEISAEQLEEIAGEGDEF